MAQRRLSPFRNLALSVSDLANFLDELEELRTLLLSSPSYLVSDPEKLLVLFEVAKTTLQENGVLLHTFASCPTHLRQHKAAYFTLLHQLQAHSHNARLDSRDLQVRLSRLLFPLSTQLKLCADDVAKAASQSNQERGTTECDDLPSADYGPSMALPAGPVRSDCAVPLSHRALPHLKARLASQPILPLNAMLPPPMPSQRSDCIPYTVSLVDAERLVTTSQSQKIRSLERARHTAHTRRRASRDTVHFKHRNPESPDLPNPPVLTESIWESRSSPQSSDSSAYDNDDVPDVCDQPLPLVIPARSPLRQSFGIFCTGKGRGTFGGSVHRRSLSHTKKHLAQSSTPGAISV